MEMKNLIKSMDCTDIKFVIEKILSITDCSKHHDRLTIPKAQAESEFLNDVEKHMMDQIDGHVIRVRVIEPCFEESYMCFRQWKMKKSSSYVLRSCWYTAREKPENKLVAGVKSSGVVFSCPWKAVLTLRLLELKKQLNLNHTVVAIAV